MDEMITGRDNADDDKKPTDDSDGNWTFHDDQMYMNFTQQKERRLSSNRN
jgi:hypothetical protein